MYSEIENVISEIKNSENIVLAGHVAPDGDAISATLALALIIKKLGKEPIVLLDEYPETYDYLPGTNLIYKGDIDILNPDLFISLDCGDLGRLVNVKGVLERAKRFINIDHHMSNDNFGDINLVNKSSSSTSEIIYEVISKLDKTLIDKDIATILYTGLVFDTCGFKHTSTTKKTHQIAGELIEKGVDNSTIHTNLIYTHSLQNAKLLSKCIQNLQITEKVCFTYLTKDEILNECLASYNDMEGISGYLLDIKGIEAVIFLYEKIDGTIKLSLRSKEIDVNEVACKFGGGGHMLASGATIVGKSINDAKEIVLKEVLLQFEKLNLNN